MKYCRIDKFRAVSIFEKCSLVLINSFNELYMLMYWCRGMCDMNIFSFCCRYLPPEIGCLKNLEHLDLSFNKMKYLPIEIGYLKALISLKVANNKLVELPPGLSSLQRLENLDLSNNRLTSLGSFELSLMHNLQTLNLQVLIYNFKLKSILSIICRDWESAYPCFGCHMLFVVP